MRMFDRLDRLANRQIDRTFAVGFVIKPMRSSANSRSAVDPERGEIIGKGVFDQEHVDVDINADRMNKGSRKFTTTTTGNSFELSVDSRRYPEVRKARQGDIVVLDDARRFTTGGLRDDGVGRIVLKLIRS